MDPVKKKIETITILLEGRSQPTEFAIGCDCGETTFVNSGRDNTHEVSTMVIHALYEHLTKRPLSVYRKVLEV